MTADEIRKRVRERLRQQAEVVRSLLALREQLEGSLFARYAECGKEGCVCRTGRKHGPYYVLSQRSGGQGSFAYLEATRVEDARLLVGRRRAFREGLKRLRRINLELVELLRRYQRAMARRGGQRLGLTPARQA